MRYLKAAYPRKFLPKDVGKRRGYAVLKSSISPEIAGKEFMGAVRTEIPSQGCRQEKGICGT